MGGGEGEGMMRKPELGFSIYNKTLIHLIFTESLLYSIAQKILKTQTKLIKASRRIASLRYLKSFSLIRARFLL